MKTRKTFYGKADEGAIVVKVNETERSATITCDICGDTRTIGFCGNYDLPDRDPRGAAVVIPNKEAGDTDEAFIQCDGCGVTFRDVHGFTATAHGEPQYGQCGDCFKNVIVSTCEDGVLLCALCMDDHHKEATPGFV
jgi:hypothetical protein